MRRFLSILLILLIFSSISCHVFNERNQSFCHKISLPKWSHFLGLSPPSNQTQWDLALESVCRGEFNLLRRVHERIKKAEDIYAPDRFFRWNHHFADILVAKGQDWVQDINEFKEKRAPILHFGRRYFEKPNFKGELTDWKGYGPENFIDFKGSFPRKTVVMGAMDENWGWLSLNILNR
jgi:hypothetical protein